MYEQINTIIRNTSSFIYPNRCLHCGDNGNDGIDLCLRCYNSLPWVKFACQRCALPLTSGNAPVCGSCSKGKFYIDRSFAPLSFEQFIRESVHKFKFNSKLNHGKLLASLLAQKIRQANLPIPELLVPVPLHRNRIQNRGFNQALEISRILSKQFGCAISIKDIRRVKSTHVQMELPATKRLANVKGAFELQSNHTEFKGKHIAIVDDVMTTGSTVNEVAKCFKKAGVEKIDVWCIARVA